MLIRRPASYDLTADAPRSWDIIMSIFLRAKTNLKKKICSSPKEKNKNQEESRITIDDFNTINESYAQYISSLSDNDIKGRMLEASIEWDEFTKDPIKSKHVLDRFGIIVIPSAINREACDSACTLAKNLCDRYISRGEEFHEDSDVVFQNGASKIKGYHNLSNYGKAVIDVRQGQDYGMIDIFNCDFAIKGGLPEIRKIFEKEEVIEALSRGKLSPRNLNIYINRNINRTRGFHVDSYSPRIKGFIYLTDVNSLNDGPYTFVKQSHQESAFRRANRKLSENSHPSTEAPIVDPLAIVPVLAPAGSLVISDQSGVHRGWPQGANGSRMVAVMNYK